MKKPLKKSLKKKKRLTSDIMLRPCGGAFFQKGASKMMDFDINSLKTPCYVTDERLLEKT